MKNEVRENVLETGCANVDAGMAVSAAEVPAAGDAPMEARAAAEDPKEAVDGVSEIPVAVEQKAMEIPKQNPMQPLKTERIYSARVYCACYNGHSKNNIFCLGMEKRCECVQRFHRAPDRTAFMEKHCVPGRIDQRCPLYEKLYELNA